MTVYDDVRVVMHISCERVWVFQKLGRYRRLHDMCDFLLLGVVGIAGVWNFAFTRPAPYGLYVSFAWVSTLFLESGLLNKPDTKECIQYSQTFVRHDRINITLLPSSTPTLS